MSDGAHAHRPYRELDAADTLYRAGKATYFEVLMAQQNTLAAELESIQASKLQRLASVALYRALGGGDSRSGERRMSVEATDAVELSSLETAHLVQH